jgi:hypothetical protein
MNSLPLDTWIRLIVWMSIGLVVYFAYSYNNSRLGKVSDADANRETPAEYTPPIAAILAIIGAIALTIWQVWGTAWIEVAVRSFAWAVTGVLVAVLMYGKGDRSGGRNAQTRNIGLIASLINLAIWAGITYWFFVHYAELHRN